MDRLIIDCETGEEMRRTLTPQEEAERKARTARTLAEDAIRQARLDRLAALRSKGAAAMTPAERNEAIDLLLGR